MKYSSFNWVRRRKHGWTVGPFLGGTLAVTVQRGSCGFGHPTKRPWTRILRLTWGTRSLELKMVASASPLGYACGKCLGIDRS